MNTLVKLAISVFCLLFISFPGAAFAELKTAYDGTNASFDVIAAVALKIVHVKELWLSSDTAENVQLICGSTVKFQTRLVANTPFHMSFPGRKIVCAAGEALKITKVTAGAKVSANVDMEQY